MLSPQRHALAERGDDLYETPPEAVKALLKAERIPRGIWEPACGPGAIVGVLRAAGHKVHATDINDYGCPESAAGVDFLFERQLPAGVEAIVTNPPFKLATEFVGHALELCPFVIVLLRLAFLESSRRSVILDDGRLARIHVFSNRLPMMHRAGWDGPKASNPMAFAWFVFDRYHAGPAALDRIAWELAVTRVSAPAHKKSPRFIRRGEKEIFHAKFIHT
jgi:hypothetical protein